MHKHTLLEMAFEFKLKAIQIIIEVSNMDSVANLLEYMMWWRHLLVTIFHKNCSVSYVYEICNFYLQKTLITFLKKYDSQINIPHVSLMRGVKYSMRRIEIYI